MKISINKEKTSPYWMVSFLALDGKMKRRSTKVPVSGGIFNKEKLSVLQSKKRALIEGIRIAERFNKDHESHDNRSVSQIVDIMLAGKLGRVTNNTYENARTAYKIFLNWLGQRANEPLRNIRKVDIKEFILLRRADVRCKTCKKNLDAIRAAFEWALDAEIINRNPCSGIKVPADTKSEKIVHEAFSIEEIQLLINKLPDEWSSAVRCCIETYGQRMGDILSLTWQAFDWKARIVRIVTGKTALCLNQPMREQFYNWAWKQYQAAQEKGGDAAIYVHPKLHEHSNPSYEFTQLVRLHDIGIAGTKGAGNRRMWHSKTFHSLRASAATMLQTSGVSQGIAMAMVGHESQEVHAVYIRPAAEQLRSAAEQMPSFD